MTGSLHLTLAYLRYHRWKTGIMIMALSLTLFLPLLLHQLIHQVEVDLAHRAEDTPMVVGPRGDRFDLVVNSLYFSTGTQEALHYHEFEALRNQSGADIIPLHLKYTAREHPVVGTDLAYFSFRSLQPASGTLPLRIGDCILGSEAAKKIQKSTGDHLLTDQTSMFNIAAAYPLNMRITGVLHPSGGPDDHAIFVDLKTTWVIDGFAHGHQEIEADQILEESAGEIKANAAVVEYNEVTPENIETFHLHGEVGDFPISSMLIRPHSDKNGTLLKAAYNQSETRQMLVSTDVIDELLGLVFRIKRFFDANFALMCVSTSLFIALVIMLSLRLRQPEMNTMFKLGCSRGTMIRLQMTEWLLIAFCSLIIAGALSVLILNQTSIWKLML